MISVAGKTRKIIEYLEDKGDPIVVIGPTAAGKSTLLSETAMSDTVKDLLSMREADGKGSTIETNVVITDSSNLDPEVLYIKGSFKENSLSSVGDDNTFLINVLYPVLRSYAENKNDNKLEFNIRERLSMEISNSSNDSLGYKLRNLPVVGNEKVDNLIEGMLLFPAGFLENGLAEIMTEIKARYEQEHQKEQRFSRPQTEKELFRELFSGRRELEAYINLFWFNIVDLLESQKDSVIDMLNERDENAVDEDGNFLVELTADDYGSELSRILLSSENESKEYLFNNLLLMFIGEDYIFEGDKEDLLTVIHRDGEDVRVLRCVDTMGAMHTEGVTTDEEADRSINLIKSNHSNCMLLVLNSYVTAVAKDAMEVVRNMMGKIRVNTAVYVIFTHEDELLLQKAQKQDIGSRRHQRSGSFVNWDEVFEEAEKAQHDIICNLAKWLECSDTKKPYIAGYYKAGFVGKGLEHEYILKKHGITYKNALKSFMADNLKRIKREGNKPRVREGIPGSCELVPLDRNYDVKSLYRNLVVDCKGNKYWPASVRATKHKWEDLAIEHESNIKENLFGYKNIRSYFVRFIRNFAMAVLNEPGVVNIDVDGFLFPGTDPKAFKANLMAYLKEDQNFGRKVAKLIGKDADIEGFRREQGYCTQSQRLNDMFQYTQDTFFKTESISLTDDSTKELLSMLKYALKKCIEDYINARCIEVY